MTTSLLRSNVAFWLTPVLLIFVIWYVGQLNLGTDRYLLDLSSQGKVALAFVASTLAACTAWEGSRWRRSHLLRIPFRRSMVAITVVSLGPIVVIGEALLIVMLERALWHDGWVTPDWRVWLTGTSTMLALLVLGFVVGVRTPAAVSVPVVLICSFLWMVALRGLNGDWLPALNSDLIACCSLNEDLDLHAVWANVLFNASLVLGCLVALASRTPMVPRLIGVLIVLIGFSSSFAVLWQLPTHNMLVSRSTGLVCQQSDVKVCLWKEHTASLATFSTEANKNVMAWQSLGLDVPTAFTEATAADVDSATGGLSAGHSTSPLVADQNLASSVIHRQPICENTHSSNGDKVILERELVGWLMVRGGATVDRVQPVIAVGPDFITEQITSTLNHVLSTSQEEQVGWYRDSLASLQVCDG